MPAPRTVALEGTELSRGSIAHGISTYPCKASDGAIYINPGSPS